MFKIKKVKPLFTGVITTAVRYVSDKTTSAGGLIYDTSKLKGTMNPYQTVVAVGSMVKDIKEGDVVRINFNRYCKANHVPGKIEDNVTTDKMGATYEIPYIEINDQKCLFLQNNDIEYIVEDYEGADGGVFE